MSERGHKRKRSLQDSPIDVSKMRMALNRLDALKAELDGIQETEEELDGISKHDLALEDILTGAMKPVRPIYIAAWPITNDIAESDFLLGQKTSREPASSGNASFLNP